MVFASPSSSYSPEIRRTRKILCVLIGIWIAFAVLGLGMTAFRTISNSSPNYSYQSGALNCAAALIWIILYGLGFLAAYRYHRIGVLVFAWFILISTIAMVIVLILAAIAAGSLIAQTSGPVTVVLIIALIIALPDAILQGFLVRYAFVLAKLLKNCEQTMGEMKQTGDEKMNALA